MSCPRSSLIRGLSAALLLALAQGVQAKPGDGGMSSQSCSFTDISVSGLQAGQFSCSGIYNGNLLNDASVGQVAGILSSLTGQSWGTAAVSAATAQNKIELGGGQQVNFAGLLYGQTVVGIHKGKGGAQGVEGTAFYAFDAGTQGLDSFQYLLSGSSGAVVFSTGLPPTPPVPEPGTYALMLAGLGTLLFLVRRRGLQSA